jgi:hypothetical protein
MRDFQAGSQGYAQIEAELSQRSPIAAAQFSRDVVDAFASRTPSTFDAGNRAAPQGLAQLLEHGGIRVSQNVSDAAVAPATASAKPDATAIDYGNIPAEHQWRYDRYLEGPSSKAKLGPNEWYAAAQRIWANNKGGNSFEQQVRTELGAPLGRGSKPVSIDGFVPDLPVGSEYGVTDVKNVGYLHDTPQLKAFAQYAKDNELPFNLIVGPRTQGISGPVLDNIRATNGTVTEYDPAPHQFSGIDIGQSGNWKRPSLQSSPGNEDQAIRATSNALEDGGKVPTLDPVSTSRPGVKAGSLGGAAAGAAVSLIQLAATGKLDPQNLGQVAKGTGEGALIGAVATKGEQFVTPAIDKVIGTTVQQSATKLAATAVSQGGADTAGVVARTLASRVAGSTVVGAVITTGVSAWENRAGLVHGDSKAIGNVVADTAVGAGSIAAATAAGAAIGSVVPVAGTAVGAVAGLAVGLAVTYGAQISGLRDDIANGAAHAVDGIKSAARGVSDAARGIGSGVSDAASSVAHFFGF